MHIRNQQFLNLFSVCGWSQAEVARRLNITPGAVSQMRSGKIRPRLSTLNLFERVVYGDNPENSIRVDPRPSLPACELKLLETLDFLPEKQRTNFVTGLTLMLQSLRSLGSFQNG
jgi:transcriptional regulator with XRE-family HTH domain